MKLKLIINLSLHHAQSSTTSVSAGHKCVDLHEERLFMWVMVTFLHHCSDWKQDHLKFNQVLDMIEIQI